MIATDKFKVGDRVEMVLSGEKSLRELPKKKEHLFGTVLALAQMCEYVKIRQDGTRRREWWHMDLWEVVK